MTPLVVTVTPTVMDGTVVRWYVSEPAAEHGSEVVSASRNGVKIDAWLSQIPDGLIDTAREVWMTLARNNRADVSGYATHRKSLGGRLTPIERSA